MSIAPCSPLIECAPGSSCAADRLFSAIYVVPKVVGGATVFWTMGPSSLRSPLEFQLEVNRAGHDLADDWEIVQPFTSGIYFATDPRHRAAGWYQRTYYRIVVRDAVNTIHRSTPIPANQGRLNSSQLSLYRELVRREQKRNRLRTTPTTPGYLLKVKYYGPRCTHCLDPDSGEPVTDNCDQCYGVGYLRGYHPAYPCFNADLGTVPSHLSMYQEQGPIVTGGATGIRFLNIPPVHPWDVWVDATSDYRYLIGQIQPLAAFGELNIVCQAAAARLGFDHPVYRISVS